MTDVERRTTPVSSTAGPSPNNEQAWLDVVTASRRRVTAYLRCMTKEPDELSELFAEVSLRAWIDRMEVLAAVAPESMFIDYARAVCAEWAVWRRHLRPLNATDDAGVTPYTERLSNSMSVEDVRLQRAWFERVLCQLSDCQWMAVDYRYRSSKSYKDIAAALGCSEATTRVHVWRGLHRLRTIVAADPLPLASEDQNS